MLLQPRMRIYSLEFDDSLLISATFKHYIILGISRDFVWSIFDCLKLGKTAMFPDVEMVNVRLSSGKWLPRARKELAGNADDDKTKMGRAGKISCFSGLLFPKYLLQLLITKVWRNESGKGSCFNLTSFVCMTSTKNQINEIL